MGIAGFEAKANAPWPVDRDRPLTSSVSLKRVQPDALERADVIQSFGGIQDGQQFQRRFDIETAKSGLAGLEQSACRRVAPRTAHLTNLQRLTWYVKRIALLLAKAGAQAAQCAPLIAPLPAVLMQVTLASTG